MRAENRELRLRCERIIQFVENSHESSLSYSLLSSWEERLREVLKMREEASIQAKEDAVNLARSRKRSRMIFGAAAAVIAVFGVSLYQHDREIYQQQIEQEMRGVGPYEGKLPILPASFFPGVSEDFKALEVQKRAREVAKETVGRVITEWKLLFTSNQSFHEKLRSYESGRTTLTEILEVLGENDREALVQELASFAEQMSQLQSTETAALEKDSCSYIG